MKERCNKPVAAIFLWLLIALGAPPAAAGPGKAPIIVGGEAGYRPYEGLDAAGRPVGFNVELMRAIGKATGREVRFRLDNWEAMRRALDSDEIDVLGMFVSERRARSVDFASPHVIASHRIFLRAGAEPIDRIQDLSGKSVIVQKKAWSHEYLEQSGLSPRLTLVDSDSEGLELLAEGRHDAALLTEHRGRHALRQRGLDHVIISGPPVLPVEYAFAVRKGNNELLATLNTGLDRVTASGEFDRIYDRWLRPLDEDAPGMDLTSRIVLAVLGILTLAAFAWLLYKLLRYRREMQLVRGALDELRERDGLTGLCSRHALERRLAALLQKSEPGEHSLLNINVDQFRVINDSQGHAAADNLLRALAQRLRQRLPKHAEIARLGADEFAVLLTGTGGEDARQIGVNLLSSLASHPLLEDQPVSVSIGLVAFSPQRDDMAAILRRADCACVAAKEEGGGQVHAWQPDDQRLAEKYGELRWVNRIQSALADDRMVPFWQPIVAAAGPPYRIVAVEILARMQNEEPSQEPIAAGRFMAAAERYFISSQIDRRIIGMMLEWMEVNRPVVERLKRINLNLSGRSLGDPRFLDFLERLLQRHRRLLPRLCLEVTETALISNLDQARRTLERLHRGGCCIALDDFGAGVSSMKYLRELPVDHLKIDGSFVRDIDSNSEAFELIREVNRLGHAVDKITLAECVETEVTARRVRQAGIDLMQGYLFGYPAPLEQLTVSRLDAAVVAGGEDPR